MGEKLFITGTDTNVGKTYISLGLIKKLNLLGYKTIGLKPISSGCQKINDTLYNDDALLLQKAASVKIPYGCVNPFAFELPIAPQFSAQHDKVKLNTKKIIKALHKSLILPADFHIIEGVGGWNVPLNDKALMSDIVSTLGLPVILVVAIKLGCLNHSILTANAIKQSGAKLLGWIANCTDPHMLNIEDNIQSIQHWLDAPCLGVVPWKGTTENIVIPTY